MWLFMLIILAAWAWAKCDGSMKWLVIGAVVLYVIATLATM